MQDDENFEFLSLDDSELAELSQYFHRQAAEHGGLSIDGVHGFLTAIAIAPEAVSAEQWLPEVLFSPFIVLEKGERIFFLLTRFHDTIVQDIGEGEYDPILSIIKEENNPTRLSAYGWCEGFIRGVSLWPDSWESRLDTQDSELAFLLAPIIALAGAEGVFSSEDEEKLSSEEFEECIEAVSAAVTSIATYWEEQPLEEDELISSNDKQTSPSRRRNGDWLH